MITVAVGWVSLGSTQTLRAASTASPQKILRNVDAAHAEASRPGVVFLRSFGRETRTQFARLPGDIFDKNVLFRPVNSKDASLLLSLNGIRRRKDESGLEWLGRLGRLLKAEIFVLASPKHKAWPVIVVRDGKLLHKGAARKPTQGLDADGWNERLLGALGYDGTVVHREGDYLVVRGHAGYLERGSQAVVVGGSNGRWEPPADPNGGSAIVEPVLTDGRLAVFRTVLKEPGPLKTPPGTKILFRDPRTRPGKNVAH